MTDDTATTATSGAATELQENVHAPTTDARTGPGCLSLLVATVVLLAAFGLSARFLLGGPTPGRGVSTVTGAAYRSSPLTEVTPQGSPSNDGSGPTAQETHEAAATGLTPGPGEGGSTNSLNPQAAVIIVPNQPTHTPPAQLEPTTPGPGHTPPPPAPCDTSDPHSPCYEPPCDTSDPHSPCYEPPPYQHNDECDPDSYYYDPAAICL